MADYSGVAATIRERFMGANDKLEATGYVAPWQPTVRPEETLEDATLRDWIGQAIGAASMCWVGGTSSFEFDSVQAARIADAVHDHVQSVIQGAIDGTAKAMSAPVLPPVVQEDRPEWRACR